MSPRGTRAIHGTEVTGHHHGIGTDQGDEFVQAEYDYLPVACWCGERFVVTTQRDVVRGLTRSCGAVVCVPPDAQPGDPRVIGPVMAPSSIIWAGFDTPKAVARFGDKLGGVIGAVSEVPALPHLRRSQTREKARPVPAEVRRQRALSPTVAARRAKVSAMYAMGHAARSITRPRAPK